jgi:hypothetical protein
METTVADTRKHDPTSETSSQAERLDRRNRTVDPDKLSTLLGFKAARDLRLPLQLVRAMIPLADAALRRAMRAHQVDLPELVSAEDLLASKNLRGATAELYYFLAAFQASRCPVPLGNRYYRRHVAHLIENAHLSVRGAPRHKVEVVFIGRSDGDSEGTSTPPEPDESFLRDSEPERVEWARGSDDNRLLNPVDGARMRALLGFKPPRNARLPLDPLRASLLGWREWAHWSMHWAHRAKLEGRTITREQVSRALLKNPKAYPWSHKVTSDLAVFIATYAVRRLPFPVSPDHHGVIGWIEEFLVPHASAGREAPELLFIGKDDPTAAAARGAADNTAKENTEPERT